MACLSAIIWIPAFAGMTEVESGNGGIEIWDDAGFPLWRKAQAGRIEILKIPPILKILILTNPPAPANR